MTGTPLRVRLLGPLSVVADGREVLLRPAPRAVLGALVLSGPTGLPAADLAEILWGADQPVAPVAGVRAQVEMLAAQLAGPREADPVERTSDGWRLARPVVTDADTLLERVTLARTHLDHGGADRARELLADDVATASLAPLDDLDEPWFAGHRWRLGRLLAAVLTTYARACTDDGAPQEAVRVLEQGLHVAAFAESGDLWEGLVRAHLAADRRDRAREVLGTAAGVLRHDPDRVQRDAALYRLSRWGDVDAPSRSAPMGPATSAQPPNLSPDAPVSRPRAVRPVTPLRFRVFGPRRIVRPDDPVRMDGGYVDAVVAVLVVRRGTAVGLDELARAVWGGDLPLKPRTAVEVNLAALAEACEPSPLPVSTHDGPAWRLDAPPEAVDLDTATALVARGRAAAAAGGTEDAATTLRQALDLTVGTPLDRLGGAWFAAERERLARWRADIVWSCVVAEVSCGRTATALPDLRALAAANPLREDVWEWLVLAAARHEGRTAGLAAYDEAARQLRRLLGAVPGPALQAVRRRVEAGEA